MDEPRFHPDHVADNLDIPSDASEYVADRIISQHNTIGKQRAEIERLRAENERAKQVLSSIVDEYDCQSYGPRIFSIEAARAALSAQEGEE